MVFYYPLSSQFCSVVDCGICYVFFSGRGGGSGGGTFIFRCCYRHKLFAFVSLVYSTSGLKNLEYLYTAVSVAFTPVGTLPPRAKFKDQRRL